MELDLDQHGPSEAAYSSNGEEYKPYMDCICGWSTGRCEDWESVGVEFALHVKESQQKRGEG